MSCTWCCRSRSAGPERLVADLAREGQRQGQRVTVACVETRGRLAAEVEALGDPRAVRPQARGGATGATVLTPAALMREALPDVIHSHQITALLYGGLAARALGIPGRAHRARQALRRAPSEPLAGARGRVAGGAFSLRVAGHRRRVRARPGGARLAHRRGRQRRRPDQVRGPPRRGGAAGDARDPGAALR